MVLRMIRILMVVFMLSGFFYCEAQVEYQSVGKIYNGDSYIDSVTLAYKVYDYCSGTTQKTCKYQYVIYGNPRGQSQYLNWKMQYFNCDGTLTELTNSLDIGVFARTGDSSKIINTDYNFPAQRIYKYFFDVRVSSSQDMTPSKIVPPPVSMTPKSIAGQRAINYGDATTLTVEGGVLGIDARWIWYRGGCGGDIVGEGSAIRVKPGESTRYYVRAEGPSGRTGCASAEVKVDLNSVVADGIDGKATVCKGEANEVLSVVGGKLGKKANWVWYLDSTSGRPIGVGERLTISPIADSRYYVRAEGETNRTEFREFAVRVIDDHSQEPRGILSASAVCKGSSIDLTVEGGRLARDAEWVWYKDGSGIGPVIGRGAKLTVTPDGNAAYYVRGEGVCNMTNMQSVKIQVNYPSGSPYGVVASTTEVYRGQRVRLSVSGGYLGSNAKWVWYKRKAGSGTVIGEGQTVTTKVHRTMHYYVRAEGFCNTTNAAGTTVYCKDRFWFVNGGVIANFIQNTAPPGTSMVGLSFSRAFDQQSYGFTIGHVKNAGWYLRGKYTFNTVNPNFTVGSDNASVTDYSGAGSYYQFNGNISENRWAATGGGIFRIVRHALFMNLGVGYGGRTVSWGIDEYSYANHQQTNTDWAKVTTESYTGAELEIGLLIRFPVLNIMIGANGLIPSNNGQSSSSSSQVHMDTYAGVGFNF